MNHGAEDSVTQASFADELESVKENWTSLGASDPMWAVLTDRGRSKGRWSVDEFLGTGRDEIAELDAHMERAGLRADSGMALDFGCGAGRLTQALALRFGAALGVDVSEAMLATARELNRLGGRCEFLHNETPDLSAVDSSSVDVVYSRRVLQHMPGGLALCYVREFFRVVRPGGIVAFQMPTRPAASLKGIGVRIVPTTLAVRLRKGMEMHGTIPEVVETQVEAAGGLVVSMVDDDAAGSGWDSVFYLCRKPEQPA